MKLLLLTTFLSTIVYVNAGKAARMLAAMQAQQNGGANPMGGANARAMRGGMGGMGAMGAPQFAQFPQQYPMYAMAPQQMAPAAPAGNPFAYMQAGGGMNPYQQNPYQQQFMGGPGGMQQPGQPGQRFKREVMKQAKPASAKTTVDTQIPVPTVTPTTTPCTGGGGSHHEDN